MKWALILFTFIVFFSTCDLAFLNGNRSYQYSLVDGDGNIEIPHIPDDEYFYVTIKSAYYTGESSGFNPLDFIIPYAMDDGPGTDCKISVNEESSTEDLYCILDVMEGDLWYHKINLKYNLPEGMCDYLGFLPHWHYNQVVGEGPAFVEQIPGEEGAPETYRGCARLGAEKREVTDENIETFDAFRCESRSRDKTTDGAWNDWGKWSDGPSGYHCGRDPKIGDTYRSPRDPETHKTKPKVEGCWKGNATDEIQYEYEDQTTNTVTVEEDENDASREYRCSYNLQDCSDTTYQNEKRVCPYNRSHEERSGLSDCCLGKYTLINRETQAEEEKEWGNEIKNCLGGLARLNWPEKGFDDNGYPVNIVESGIEGVNKEYTLDPLIETTKNRYSLPTANFFKAIEDEKTAEPPAFYNSPPDPTPENPARVRGHPFLTWSCFDPAREVKHRIHLLIREWNTKEEFTRFKESEGGSGDPDISGAEGSECEYYEKDKAIFGDCNDLYDSDDTIKYPEIKYSSSG